ncbi:MAG: glycosyltransferase family 4 protein [Chloroflexota bacterium]|nr:glycosyltransferase family 4 protein [Chloroflexota bacterium]MDQ5866002.1 glycosyltransferase family 4 protein [Chloroflexota bacterium]
MRDPSQSESLGVCLLTDVFPPKSGGSGWSTYYLGKALSERGHHVRVLRPVYGNNVPRPTTRTTGYEALPVEEVLVPGPPAWAIRAGAGKAWSQRMARRLLAKRAASLVATGAINVLHGQHQVSGIAAVKAASRASRNAVSVVTVRDYWPLCPVSTRLFETPDGGVSECEECHRLPKYLRCARPRGMGAVARIPLNLARWLKTLADSRQLASSDMVIAVSSYVSRELSRSGRVPPSRLNVIPNLVDLPSVDRALGGEWPLHDISPEDRFLLFAGKLDTNKGAWQLPQALARAAVAMPVVIAGDGPWRDRIATEAAGLGLDFRFYDWLDNDAVLRLMNKAAALLFPSAWQEPLSRVLLEGCAAGAAIVALNTGGTSDLIEHGTSGWLAYNLDEFASGTRVVVTNAEPNAHLRRGARQRAEDKFAAPAVSARVEELYRSLLAQRGTRQ